MGVDWVIGGFIADIVKILVFGGLGVLCGTSYLPRMAENVLEMHYYCLLPKGCAEKFELALCSGAGMNCEF